MALVVRGLTSRSLERNSSVDFHCKSFLYKEGKLLFNSRENKHDDSPYTDNLQLGKGLVARRA